MIKPENRFHKHTAKAFPCWQSCCYTCTDLLFTDISIWYSQNPFSIHSSVNVQEEQINMPKQNVQILGDKAHFPTAQKLQNTIVQFITFFILMPESIFFCENIQCTENPESIQLRVVWSENTTPMKGSLWTTRSHLRSHIFLFHQLIECQTQNWLRRKGWSKGCI